MAAASDRPVRDGGPPASGRRGRPAGWLFARILVVGLTLAGLAPSRGAAPAEVFDAAAKLYAQGHAAEAAAAYESLVTNGVVTSSVLFNQGNAWLQAGQVGRAITSYRRAQRLAPRDADIAEGLRQARKQVSGTPDPGPGSGPAGGERWLSILTANEWAWLAFGAVWTWFGLLLVRRLRPRFREATASLVWGLAWVAVGAVGGAALAGARDPRAEAVVVAPEAVVRFGPLDESQSAFTLPNGAEVRVVDRKNDWCQVRDGAGRRGWVPERLLATP